MLEVNLTYFMPTGKYYAEGSFFVLKSTPLFEIWDMVADLRKKRKAARFNARTRHWLHCIG